MVYNEDLLQSRMKLSEQGTTVSTSMSISFAFIAAERSYSETHTALCKNATRKLDGKRNWIVIALSSPNSSKSSLNVSSYKIVKKWRNLLITTPGISKLLEAPCCFSYRISIRNDRAVF